jgi:uroporphyrinogen decarboxylase
LNDRFLRACRREAVDCTPIWLMRQAGRYLPEYRAVRERHAMLDVIRTPELAVEVTLQPLRRFALDAAIIFADILPPLIGMGIDLEFAKGEGPVIHNPVRTPADISKLQVPAPEENVAYTLEAIRMARRELDGKTPLIGFSGAPFTLASYMIEGGSSRNYMLTKTLMYREPAAWHMLMDKLARLVGEYLVAQVRAGAQAVQVFDSWAGSLSPSDYARYVLPYTRAAIEMARAEDVPVIHFSTDTAGIIMGSPNLVRAAGSTVVGLDWRVDLGAAWDRLGDVAVQGNLDPLVLFGDRDVIEREATYVLQQANGRRGHIFNFGHGFLPQTPIDSVHALIEVVHGWSLPNVE